MVPLSTGNGRVFERRGGSRHGVATIPLILPLNDDASPCRLVFLFEAEGTTLGRRRAEACRTRLARPAKLSSQSTLTLLRHAAGYVLAADGVDTRTLQAFMGHRSI